MSDYANKLSGIPRSNVAAAGVAPSPGKRTLVEQVYGGAAPIQRRTASDAAAPALAARSATAAWPRPAEQDASASVGAAHADPGAGATHAAARDGLSGPAGALPHLDPIQQLFGRHDVSSVQAHVGGAAADASQRMGAQAYATGDHVAFRSPPDLHTAAHEAAHVVQQRGGVQLEGGVGQDGDAYERHADAVADAVVAGRPAGMLLDEMAPAGARRDGAASAPVQRQAQPHPPRLTGSVGDGGANQPGDVRVVQDRLLALGFLSRGDHAAEQVNPQPAQAAVAASAIPRTIAAISAFSRAALGQPLLQISPGQVQEAALVAAPPVAAANVHLTGAVGAGAANAAADVRAVQDRLLAVGLLTSASHAAERVDPQSTRGAIADAAIPRTIAAIQRFHREVLASSLAQIRPGSDEQALNNPPRFRQAAVDITTSVGTGGTNAPASVRAVQDRLEDLGYLAGADFAAEQVSPTAQANIAAAALPRTIAAIQALQTTLGNGRVVASGLIAPGDVSHRLLMNPAMPVPQAIALGARVGRGGPNHAADVQLVQGRLRELGFLSTGDFLAERTAPGAAQVAEAAIPRTLEAIERFQASIVGIRPDGRIDPGGLSARLLQDPTYGTRTVPNPNAINSDAGPIPASFGHDVQQIITACETVEAGAGGQGERPAVLRNGSGTPASFGRGQLIGETAVGTLQNNPSITAIYGLSAQDLRDLNGIAARTGQHYTAISNQVPAGGAASDAALLALAAGYTTAHGQRFHVETGLFDTDIAAMFRTAQFRRHLAGHVAGDEAALMNPAQHPAAAANIAALGLSRGDVRSYLAEPRRHGEHRAGLITRALFMSEHGQQLRNAMTDHGGTGIGRALINDNFRRVVQRAAQLHLQLTAAQRAEVTARVHNQGEGNLDAFLTNLPATHTDPYVRRFRQHWVP